VGIDLFRKWQLLWLAFHEKVALYPGSQVSKLESKLINEGVGSVGKIQNKLWQHI
jgi:hypothetical protein